MREFFVVKLVFMIHGAAAATEVAYYASETLSENAIHHEHEKIMQFAVNPPIPCPNLQALWSPLLL